MLTDADHRRVLDALHHLTGMPAAGFDRVALLAVREVVRCDVASINDVDPTIRHFAYAFEPPEFIAPPHTQAVLAEYAHEHPLVRYAQATGDGSARRISDEMGQGEFRRTPLYRLVYRELGAEFQMAITLDLPLPTVVAIAVSRGDEDFSDDERDRLELLRPHLRSAWLQSQERSRLEALLVTATAGGETELAGAELSAREIEILGLLITGETNRGIAGRLHIAPGTVKKHLDSVYCKLGVRGRVQAVTLALELGLRRPEAAARPDG